MNFDCASQMPPDPELVRFHAEAVAGTAWNQEASHAAAKRVRRQIGEAAEILTSSLYGDCRPRRVIWGNSATGVFRLLADFASGGRVLTTRLEHPAVTANLKRTAAKVDFLRCDAAGVLDAESSPREKYDAVFCHAVQSELGTVQRAAEIFAPHPDALHVVDAVALAGKAPLAGCRGVTVISGSKFGCPGGAAAMIDDDCPQGEKLFAFAGHYRTRDYLTDRVAPAVILTLAEAARRRRERMAPDEANAVKNALLLRAGVADLPLCLTVPMEKSSPYIVHLTLRDLPGAVVVRSLSERGIIAASGSACASESREPSPAMLAIGQNRKNAYNSLRLSFGFDTAADDVARLTETLAETLNTL